MGRGIFAYNTMLTANNPSAALYCQPVNLTIEATQYISILRQYVEQSPTAYGPMYLELALLNALEAVFPCSRRR